MYAGTAADLEEERARLVAGVERLRAMQPVAATEPSDETEDPRGEKLAVLLAWRRHRQAALETEIERLRQAAGAAAAGVAAATPALAGAEQGQV